MGILDKKVECCLFMPFFNQKLKEKAKYQTNKFIPFLHFNKIYILVRIFYFECKEFALTIRQKRQQLAVLNAICCLLFRTYKLYYFVSI